MRKTWTSAVALLALILGIAVLVACAAYREQHAPAKSDSAASSIGIPAVGSGDSLPDAKPPSKEFCALNDDAQIFQVRGEIELAKANLAAKGRYACCVKPSCNECLLHRGECHCRKVVEKNGPCCGECTEAWIEGRGAVEGLNALELLKRKEKGVMEKGQGGEEHQHHP
jgi:hypothetical protein